MDNPGLVVHGAGDLRIEEMGPPLLGEHDALVEIAFGGICGSDLHYWRSGAVGDSVIREPLLLGHEVVGTVRRAAADNSGPAVGTRVAVHPGTTGGTARYPIGRPNLSSGSTYLGSAAQTPHTPGAFARFVGLPTRMLRSLPESLSLRDAAIVEPTSVAWHAVLQAGAVAGRRVLVVGAGPIGALVVAVLAAVGVAEIVVVDVHAEPLLRVRALGADRTMLANDPAIHDIDADITFEASGSPHGLASAINGTTRAGRVVMVGMPPRGEQPALLSLVVTRELQLVGSFRFTDEIDDVILAMAERQLVADAIVTHVFAIADALNAFEIALDPTSGKVLIDFSVGAGETG
jgi:L-idonate 5-dehydrogenase